MKIIYAAVFSPNSSTFIFITHFTRAWRDYYFQIFILCINLSNNLLIPSLISTKLATMFLQCILYNSKIFRVKQIHHNVLERNICHINQMHVSRGGSRIFQRGGHKAMVICINYIIYILQLFTLLF